MLNEYTQLLRDRPLELFKKYSVAPPDGVNQLDQNGKFIGARAYSDPKAVSNDPLYEGFKWGEVSADRRIGWIALTKGVTGRDPVPGGSLMFKVNKDRADNMIPVYFLPWESRCLLRMKIPAKDPHRDDPDDPNIFFTAAINGCSVFVHGDARSPEVYHAGISQGTTPYGNDPARFWRDLLGEHLTRRGLPTAIGGEVNNRDYINQTGVSGRAWTGNSDKVQQFIDAMPKSAGMVREVTPWGCVFGIRYGSSWTFYLQENAKVTTYRVERKVQPTTYSRLVKRNAIARKLTGGGNYKLTFHQGTEVVETAITVRSESFPMVVRSFFPGGGRVDIKSPEFRTMAG